MHLGYISYKKNLRNLYQDFLFMLYAYLKKNVFESPKYWNHNHPQKCSINQATSLILQYLWKVTLLMHSLNINHHQRNGWFVNINPGFGPLENLEEHMESSPLEQTAQGKHEPRATCHEISVDLISYIKSQHLKKNNNENWGNSSKSNTNAEEATSLTSTGSCFIYITLTEVNFALVSVVTEGPRGHESKPTDTNPSDRSTSNTAAGWCAHKHNHVHTDTYLHSLLCIHQMFLLNPRVGF